MGLALVGFLQGLIIGSGAILPGISGASLAVVFGLYEEFLDLIAHPLKNALPFVKRRHSLILGIACGFIAFTLMIDKFFGAHQGALVALFTGFIAGTLPGIFSGAKKNGIGHGEILAFLATALSLVALSIFKGISPTVPVAQTAFPVWILCGAIIGIGSLLPGLSASFLLIPLGLYGPLLDAVADLNLRVGVGLGLGVLAAFALLSRFIETLYRHFHGIMSFAVLGLTLGSLVLAFPHLPEGKHALPIAALYVVLLTTGFTASFFLDKKGN